jgi:hypothetical protein
LLVGEVDGFCSLVHSPPILFDNRAGFALNGTTFREGRRAAPANNLAVNRIALEGRGYPSLTDRHQGLPIRSGSVDVRNGRIRPTLIGNGGPVGGWTQIRAGGNPTNGTGPGP